MPTNVFKFLWQYFARQKVLFFSTLSFVILGEVFIRGSAYYVSKIVEIISSSGIRDEVFRQAVIASIFATILYLLHRLSYDVMTFVEAKFLPFFATIISKDLFYYVHQHSTAFFAEQMAGNVAGKIKTIISESYHIYYSVLWGFFYPCTALILSLGFMFFISPSITFIMTIFSMVYVYLVYMLSKKLSVYSEKRAKTSSESDGVLVDSLTNTPTVKSFSNYIYERRRYFKARMIYARADRVETIKYAWFFVYRGFVQSLIQITFYTVPVWYWYKGYINIGDFVMIQSLIAMIMGVAHQFSNNLMQFFKMYGGIKDGLKLLSIPYDLKDIPNAKPLKIKKADIVFNNVTYYYKKSKPLFEDFNLDIKAGEKIGLVGHSGSGKSTLVKILSRYYDLQGGEILIDGQDIAKVTQDSLRRNISLIPQDTSLFNRTIMENIRYGNINASDEEVYEAAKKAYIHDFIIALPDGYQAKVGERGVMLSGGERQRIAIARAILKNAPILILDEATSALDSASEKYIQESMKELMNGKTVIAIAHRLSTLKEMDKIIVMEKGKIKETGTHTSLLRKKGLYHGFYEMQSQGFLNL